jgi:transposase
MRGKQDPQTDMFSYIPLEKRIREDHPLRSMKKIVDEVLESMNKDFDAMYSHTGRPSIPPEMLIKTLFLQVLYGIRSEFQVLEQLDYNLLYRWFVGLSADDKIWDETVFTKNRDRLFSGYIAERFFSEVIKKAKEFDLMSSDHFSVDGTLIESWASLKSFKAKDGEDKGDDDGDPGNPSVDFHGEKRSNKTHSSTTDPEAKIFKKSKGTAAKLCYMGHALMENRNGLIARATVTEAGYYAEHDAAIKMIDELKFGNRRTLGADKHYDSSDFCEKLRERKVTPHVAMNIHARRHSSAIDGRTSNQPGYLVSIRKRKRIEEIFGWMKQYSIMRRPHFRGRKRIETVFCFSACVYNILRISNLTTSMA